MTSDKIPDEIRTLAEPIVAGLVVFDEGCEFNILTSERLFPCTVGGVFPLIGPVTLSPAQQAEIKELLSLQGEGQTIAAAVERVSDEDKRSSLLEVLEVLGEDAVTEVVRLEWPSGTAFYVFHDMGCGESAAFSSLEAAYEHFVDYFTSQQEGIRWEDLGDDELLDWAAQVKELHERGSDKLPPSEWLGAYDGPVSGSGRVG